MEIISKWRPYNGFRVAHFSMRAVIAEHINGDRLYAYVERTEDGFMAWFERDEPGQLLDMVVGIYGNGKDAMKAIANANADGKYEEKR